MGFRTNTRSRRWRGNYSYGSSLRIEPLEERRMLSAAPVLVKDINATTDTTSLWWVADLDGDAYFATSDNRSGSRLWRSDGTAEGTELVSELEGHPQLSNGTVPPVAFKNHLYFYLDQQSEPELWVTDGSAEGTERAFEGLTNIASLTVVGQRLFFTASDSEHGNELWATDGTIEGTYLVQDIEPGNGSSSPLGLNPLGDELIFVAERSDVGRELWTTDGETVELVRDIKPGPESTGVGGNFVVGEELFFTVPSADTPAVQTLWKTDGTFDGTVPIQSSDSIELAKNPQRKVVYDGKLYFTISNSIDGIDLWVSNGTDAGTHRVADLAYPRPPYGTSELVVANDLLFLVVQTSNASFELWASDGSASGTRIVEISSDPTTANAPRDLIEYNGALYFVANSVDGSQLWKTLGNDHDAQQVTHVLPGSGSGATNLMVAAERLYFRSFDPQAGYEPFSSDGTPGGTVLLGDLNPASRDSNPSDYVAIGDTVYFFATDAVRGRALWKSDGTAEGTEFVYSTPKGGINGYFQELQVIHGRLYFAAADDQGGLQFWESDGTAAGTRLITSVPYNVITYEEYAFSTVIWPHLVEAGGTLFFSGRNIDGEFGGAGFSLWKIDDSPMGASVVKSFPPQDDRGPRYLTSVAGKLYFTAPDDSATRKIWVSDGTLEGTHPVADYQPIDAMVSLNDDLYFYTRQTTQPRTNTLWRFDPETELVNLVREDVEIVASNVESQPIIGSNGTVYFAGTDGELWSTNGTESGSNLVATLFPNEPGTRIRQFAKAGGLLYFTVDRPDHPIELWRIDQTANELVLVGQNLGLTNRTFANVDGRLFFSGQTFVESDGSQRLVIALFVTDGTPAGTHVVATDLPGFSLARWPELGVSNGRVFFTKDDGVHGDELFMIPASAPGDANGDGVVDYADYTKWADHFLQPGDWGFAQGDFNRDGIVDAGDYTLWADNYLASPTQAAAMTALVESSAPASAAPVAAAAAAPEARDASRATLDSAARRTLAWAAAVESYFGRRTESYFDPLGSINEDGV